MYFLGGGNVESIIQGVVNTFGLSEAPTNFPEFFHWLCCAVVAIVICKVILGTLFALYGRMMEVNR